MKKQLQRKYGVFIALLSVLLGLGACMNPLQPPVERGPGNTGDGSTGLRISIVAGEARTLLPSTEFSKYVLHFSNSEGVTAPPDITLTAVNTDVVSLDPADWTITVTAYVQVEGVDVAAAEGSAQVSLAANELKGVSIRVSAKLDGGGDGYFSYSVSYPGDVQSGSLSVYEIGQTPVIDNTDLLSEPTGSRIVLAAGYYGLRIRLNTSLGVAVRTEIVHIYPGMETRGDYAFTEADFGSPVTISGTVDLSGLGAVDFAAIQLYRNSDFTYLEESFYESSPSDTWSWSIRTLPFNQPTDLYIALGVRLSDGSMLIKQLPAPVSVYNQDAAAPAMGPFTVNRFDLSGVVDFSALISLEVTNIDGMEVEVYLDGNTPISLGGSSFSSPEIGVPHPWSFSILTEETSLPVLLNLRVQIYGETLYDQIRTTLTASRSDLDFRPGPVSAETMINGVGSGSSDYGYLFVPDASGEYAFNLSGAGSQYVELNLYDAMGSHIAYASGYPDAALSSILSAEDAYYIRFDLESPYRAFQFRVDPVNQVSLGGTVDFSGLLSSFSDVTVNNAAMAIHADNSVHTLLGTSSINTGDGSWSAQAGLVGPSIPAVFVITADLSNGVTISDQVYGTISGNDSNLNFSPAAVGLNPVTRTIINSYDYLLYVPAATGDHSLRVSQSPSDGPAQYMQVYVYDAQANSYIASTFGYGELELVQTLTAGNPYLIRVNSSAQFVTYQFQAEELQPVTLSGTVDFSGLSSWDTASAEVFIFSGSDAAILGTGTVSLPGGAWSVSDLPPSGEVFIALFALSTGGEGVLATQTVGMSGGIPAIVIAPGDSDRNAAVATGIWHARSTNGVVGGWLLWIPESAGTYVLDAEKTDSMDPYMYLYDGLTGSQIDYNDDGGGNYNSRIQRDDFEAGHPYLIRVRDYGNGFGNFQFKAEAVVSP